MLEQNTNGDTSAAPSPSAAPAGTTASLPSDTGAGTSQQAAKPARDPIPYDRFEAQTRAWQKKESEWKQREQQLMRQQQQAAESARVMKLLEQRLAPPPKQYDDPLEESVEKLRSEYDARFKTYESERDQLREQLRGYETVQLQRQLESEHQALCADPRFTGISSFAKSKEGIDLMTMFLTQNATASMQDAFEYVQGLVRGLTPQQAAAQAVAPDPTKKPPVLDVPGAGGGAIKQQPRPRTMEDAAKQARAALG